MTCPKCGGKNRVWDSRADCEAVYRTRICKVCNHMFYTVEYEIESDEDIRRVHREMYKDQKKNVKDGD